MKTYKKIMNGVAMVEKLILVLATILIVVLTVGNVLSRKLLHQSWSFTEELVVAVFVLITLMAAALAARDGELVPCMHPHDCLRRASQDERWFLCIPG